MTSPRRSPSKPLLELDDALQCIQTSLNPISQTLEIKPSEALGYTLSKTVRSPLTLPPFTNSSVDGYAFVFEQGTPGEDLSLALVGTSLAGHPFQGTISKGQAVRIATGARLPEGADTIVMQEQCVEDEASVRVTRIPDKGACVRHAGSDFKEGMDAIAAGRRLAPPDVALLRALQVSKVDVYRPLKIALFSTGAELKADGQSLADGQIIDTNGLMLKQLLSAIPAEIDLKPALPDTYQQTYSALLEASAHYDLVLTSGGVSVGSHDFVRDVLHEAGVVHFWRLAIRPGKPVLYGAIEKCAFVCLPGNPVSAMVTFLLIVVPALSVLHGGEARLPPSYAVPLAKTLLKEKHLRTFARASLRDVSGKWTAVPYLDQGSHLIGSLVATDGLLDLPAGTTKLEEGELVQFRPFSSLYL